MHRYPARRRTRPLVVAALFVAGLTLSLGPPAAQGQSQPASGSAFGLSAELTFPEIEGDPTVIDPIAVAPTPVVECPPDSDDSVAEISEGEITFDEELINGDLPVLPELPVEDIFFLTATALDVACGDDDGDFASLATVADLVVADALLAEVISAECAVIDGELSGDSNIADLTFLGEDIEGISGEPNEQVDLDGATLTVNRQVTTDNPDGSSSLTVDALVLEFPEDSPVAEFVSGELVVASVTCTTGVDDTAPPPTEPPATTEPPAAPGPGAPPAQPIPGQPTFTG